jgi:glycosyltransferase involved in cell wall biosynthesis
MSSRPTVLIATLTVASRTGTEIYTRDLAQGLLRRGWRVVVYATSHGAVAEELRRATIPVIDSLDDFPGEPDVIHGHHGLETVAALLRFPSAPALFVCHDGLSWHSIPPVVERIRRFVAVDENCLDRIVCEHGVPADRTVILANAVDLEKFEVRGPLPPAPRKALVFSNGAREAGYVSEVRRACSLEDIELDVAGSASGRSATRPEILLRDYDIVFAKARCALEALTVGCSVVVLDAGGLGEMVTSRNVDRLRALNFGARSLTRPLDPEAIRSEIRRYDADDAACVTTSVRRTAGIELLVSSYVSIYEELIGEALAIDRLAETAALSRYVQRLSGQIQSQVGALLGSPAASVGRKLLASRRLAPLLRLAHHVLGGRR